MAHKERWDEEGVDKDVGWKMGPPRQCHQNFCVKKSGLYIDDYQSFFVSMRLDSI